MFTVPTDSVAIPHTNTDAGEDRSSGRQSTQIFPSCEKIAIPRDHTIPGQQDSNNFWGLHGNSTMCDLELGKEMRAAWPAAAWGGLPASGDFQPSACCWQEDSSWNSSGMVYIHHIHGLFGKLSFLESLKIIQLHCVQMKKWSLFFHDYWSSSSCCYYK